MDVFLAIALAIAFIVLYCWADSARRTARQREPMSCTVSSEALKRCQDSANALIAAIEANQAEARAYAAAVNKRNAEIVAWESAHAVQLEKRDNGRVASSSQVWFENRLFDCNKLPDGV